MVKKINSRKIRLLIIEDNKILREGISKMLKPQKDIFIVAASGKSADTILKIHELKPNVILLDLGLRSLNSLRVVELVKKEFPQAKIIVMDLVPVEADIVQFLNAGASGFIFKDATSDVFVTTIRSIAKGAKVLPSDMSGSLFTQIVSHAIKGRKVKFRSTLRMTKTEREIFNLIADASTNKDISLKLHIPIHNVKSHIHNILEKIALHSRLETSNFAFTEKGFDTFANGISIIKN